MSLRVTCANGGWVGGTRFPFPTDPAVHQRTPEGRVVCNQLFCGECGSPVKHLEGVKTKVRAPTDLRRMYDQLDPDAWLDVVELNDEYRLYFCRCSWFSTPSWMPVGHLDTRDIDQWRCAGHPPG